MTVRNGRVIVIIAVILLAGCGTGDNFGATPSLTVTSQPSRDAMTTVSPPAWAQDDIDSPVAVVTSPDNTSLAWRFVSLSGDGRKIRVLFTKGDDGCTTFKGFLVSETATTVTLTATASTPAQGACHAVLLVGAGTVTLAAPLGQRELVHAAVSPAWVNSLP